jgi:hypothetical protein
VCPVDELTPGVRLPWKAEVGLRLM